MAVLPEEGGRIADDGGPFEVVVAHDKLLESLEKGGPLPGDETTATEALKPYKDRHSVLWGLRRGNKITVLARYAEVGGVADGLAAVRFPGGGMGVVDEAGNCLLAPGAYAKVRLLKDRVVEAAGRDGRVCYVDLLSGRQYQAKPKVQCFGRVQMLDVGGAFYSRTKRVYVCNRGAGLVNAGRYGFCLRIHDYFSPPKCRQLDDDDARMGHDSVCLFADDHETYYHFSGLLVDGTMVVADCGGNYYLMADGQPRRLVASDAPPSAHMDFGVAAARLKAEAARRAAERDAAARRGQEEARLGRLAAMRGAVPFRSGLKWGLRLGGRVVVPPVYRNIQPPVGNYCAVEDSPCRWGVIMLDGKVVVDFRYMSVEICAGGTARLTIMPGKTKTVKLGV